jgi:hypothetical protein
VIAIYSASVAEGPRYICFSPTYSKIGGIAVLEREPAETFKTITAGFR